MKVKVKVIVQVKVGVKVKALRLMSKTLFIAVCTVEQSTLKEKVKMQKLLH